MVREAMFLHGEVEDEVADVQTCKEGQKEKKVEQISAVNSQKRRSGTLGRTLQGGPSSSVGPREVLRVLCCVMPCVHSFQRVWSCSPSPKSPHA